jgi:hypothetical protein
MVFAENLEITLCLSNKTFGKIVDPDLHSLLSINSPVIFGLATRTFKITFLCYSSLCILGVLDHFSCDTLSASSIFTADHENRLSCSKIEAMLALKAVQFI